MQLIKRKRLLILFSLIYASQVPGLMGGKMSASDPNSKVGQDFLILLSRVRNSDLLCLQPQIDMLEDPAVVKKKIKAAFCEEKNITENGLLSFAKAVIFPVSAMRATSPFAHADSPSGTLVSITRDDKYGGNIHYSAYQQMEDSFASGELYPADLKRGMTDAINTMLKPILKAYEEDEEWKTVDGNAYPKEEPVKKVKEVKKVRRFVVFGLERLTWC